ncbi:hypothetical protein L1987_70675 [Smallanthus sonchifolius]|uniref:Uncharacterized protein n=1 Tax=Smallanthus sonchifolius TaxID=185202 RepID=A0ACB9AQX0_9ASTR|nr:hypothetical protein L1987_70675 [Smallanthus sonchifolius]
MLHSVEAVVVDGIVVGAGTAEGMVEAARRAGSAGREWAAGRAGEGREGAAGRVEEGREGAVVVAEDVDHSPILTSKLV